MNIKNKKAKLVRQLYDSGRLVERINLCAQAKQSVQAKQNAQHDLYKYKMRKQWILNYKNAYSYFMARATGATRRVIERERCMDREVKFIVRLRALSSHDCRAPFGDGVEAPSSDIID